jgi:hypothetical protein
MSLFTQEDLLLYLYKETSPEQTIAIRTALSTDWNLMEQLNFLQSSIGLLTEELVAPRFNIVQQILQYAEKPQKAIATV